MSDQPVFGAGSHRSSKGSASNVTLFRRLIGLTVVGVALAIIYFAVKPLNHAIRLTFENPAATEQYAVVSSKGLTLAGTSKVLPIGGGEMKDPYAVTVGDWFAFCDRRSLSVTLVNPKGSSENIQINQQFGESDRILRLYPAAAGVYVVIQDLSDTASVRAATRPTKTLYVKFDKTSETVSEDQAVEPNPGGNQFVSRAIDGTFTWNEGGTPTVLAKLQDAVIWSTDFGAKVVAVAGDKSVTIINNGKQSSFTPAMAHRVTDVRVRPDLQEIWVAVAKMGGGTGVLAYDYTGNFKSFKANSKDNLYGPYTPKSPAVDALLAQVQ